MQKEEITCFVGLDSPQLDEPFPLRVLAVPDKMAADYPIDPLERILDRYGIEGAAICAADLEETPDDRGEFIEVVCRVRRPA